MCETRAVAPEQARARQAGGAEPAPPGAAGLQAAAERDDAEPAGMDSATLSRGTRRLLVTFVVLVLAAVALLYFGVPNLAGLNETWQRIKRGDPWWIGAGILFELFSFLSYVALFRTVYLRETSRITWAASYDITMAGLAATRLLAAAGAGGIALTVWALRRSGMPGRTVAARMVAFLVLLYAVYALSLLLTGIGLRAGVLSGRAPFGLTVVPAIVAAIAIGLFLAMSLIPKDFERRLVEASRGYRRSARLARRVATVPDTVARGVRAALELFRERRWGLLGAAGWWAFDIAVLWACFHAFGDAPTIGVIVMCYFVGMSANALPFFPGGVGSVDAGMIGAFLAFGVPGSAAVVAVLTYRGIAFWLPTLPGAVAYISLRRRVARWREEDAAGGAPAARAAAPAPATTS